ncbi:MAG: phosphate acyltransferase [bacterium]
MIRNFEALLKEAKAKGPKNIVVSGGDDAVAIEELQVAKGIGLINKVFLVGDKEKIGKFQTSFEVVSASAEETPLIAAQIAGRGEADIIMKGKVSTSAFLKGVLDKSTGLRIGRTMSHIAVMSTKFYDKLLFITDGGMNIYPNLEVKSDILMNAVDFAHKLGIECPKVAIVCAIEVPNPDMPETMDAVELVKMAGDKKFGVCEVAGPFALDLAVSSKACELKGIKHSVCGDADILIMPNIAAGNISAKSMIYLGGASIAGAVMGAKLPCVMLSRSDSKDTKLNSIALGVVSC